MELLVSNAKSIVTTRNTNNYKERIIHYSVGLTEEEVWYLQMGLKMNLLYI
ncbi:hypothetical protein ACIQ34_10410 [Ureibacillus sp. NPDC094379]